MNIWLINQYANVPQQPGPTRHFMLAKYLAEAGHQPIVIASSFSHVLRRDLELAPGVDFRADLERDVPWLWVSAPAYKGNSPARIWNMFVFGAKVARGRFRGSLPRPDVILGSSPPLFSAFGSFILARRLGIAFVLEVRDLWPLTFKELGGFPMPAIKALEVIERFLYRNSDEVVTLLPDSYPHLVKNGARREHITWIPNGIDIKATSVATSTLEGPYGQGLFRVVYAGTFGFANELDVLLDAASILEARGCKNVRIELIGDGPRRSHLQNRISSEKLESVRIGNPVSKTQVGEVLEEADALVMMLRKSPLWQWGISPNKLFDYMAAGKPIIFGVEAPHNPVAESAGGLVVPPNDPAALAEAIQVLSQMPKETKVEMGRRSRVYVEKHHSMELLAGRMEEVLVRAAFRRSRSA